MTAITRYRFKWSHPSDPYLVRLRKEYCLDQIVAGATADYDRARLVCRWVHTLWKHDSSHQAPLRDPISILHAVAQGARFRCVESSIVAAGALNALGIPARVLGLMTRDVETREADAGHMVVEAYLQSLAKWIMIDAQAGVIPAYRGALVNALELRNALPGHLAMLEANIRHHVRASSYVRWIAPYLFYFDVPLDNRYGVPDRELTQLLVIPAGATAPKFFQGSTPLSDRIYTYSTACLYAPPEWVVPELTTAG